MNELQEMDEFDDIPDEPSLRGEIADHTGVEALDETDLIELMTRGQILYGATDDESLVPDLLHLYRHAMALTTPGMRMDAYQTMADLVETTLVSVNALLPFLLIETDQGIVSTAAIDTAMYGCPERGDLLSWPRHLARQVVRREPANVGAVFGGLVSLGDRRINPVLEDVRDSLTLDDVGTATQCVTGFSSLAAFEFWLEWLETLPGNPEDALWGYLAGALYRLARPAVVPELIENHRNFGYIWEDEVAPGWWGPQLTPKEVGERYAPRLYELEEREASPKVMSTVLIAYGLEPKARPVQRYVVH